MENTENYLSQSALNQPAQALNRIAIAIEGLIAISDRGPEWEYDKASFQNFPWAKHGISVKSTSRDNQPSCVDWMGHQYYRIDIGEDTLYRRNIDRNRQAILILFVSNNQTSD